MVPAMARPNVLQFLPVPPAWFSRNVWAVTFVTASENVSATFVLRSAAVAPLSGLTAVTVGAGLLPPLFAGKPRGTDVLPVPVPAVRVVVKLQTMSCDVQLLLRSQIGATSRAVYVARVLRKMSCGNSAQVRSPTWSTNAGTERPFASTSLNFVESSAATGSEKCTFGTTSSKTLVAPLAG